ncbi:GntR family transcriptional regulator [Aneurinibacillus terranovensis]|uniref:GntR family transcriptional regulator n=1 Tax=Aneurinibacillus terranovensis TaxID=278991 RepID=UPI0004170E00|nr:GntR family transcriptional regulator [Aneurinibacillus terranovensis]
MIKKDSPIPLYYQLEEYIRSQINSGAMKPKEAIPSEREISEELGISRMTVRQAITNLVNDGLLVRHKGKGTFVAEKKFEKGPSVFSFTEEMRRRNLRPSARIIEMKTIPAGGSMAEQLEIPTGESVYEICRLRLADDEPMAIETAYIPVRYIPGLNEQLLAAKGSLYELLHENGIKLRQVERTLEASLATANEAKLLNIKSKTAVLLVKGRTYSEEGKVIEFVKSIYRGDRYTFAVKFNNPSEAAHS